MSLLCVTVVSFPALILRGQCLCSVPERHIRKDRVQCSHLFIYLYLVEIGFFPDFLCSINSYKILSTSYLPIYLTPLPSSIYLSIYLSIPSSIFLSIYLSVNFAVIDAAKITCLDHLYWLVPLSPSARTVGPYHVPAASFLENFSWPNRSCSILDTPPLPQWQTSGHGD